MTILWGWDTDCFPEQPSEFPVPRPSLNSSFLHVTPSGLPESSAPPSERTGGWAPHTTTFWSPVLWAIQHFPLELLRSEVDTSSNLSDHIYPQTLRRLVSKQHWVGCKPPTQKHLVGVVASLCIWHHPQTLWLIFLKLPLLISGSDRLSNSVTALDIMPVSPHCHKPHHLLLRPLLKWMGRSGGMVINNTELPARLSVSPTQEVSAGLAEQY